MINLLSCAAFSCSKNVEHDNQDAILLPRQVDGAFVFAVADGGGSYPGAKDAANIATSQHAELNKEKLLNPQLTLELIQNNIIALSNLNNEYFKAATTLSYCFLTAKELNVIHVGDTRVYIKKGGKLNLVTKDHTQHQELLDDGLYTKKELEQLPGKNTLTAALTRSLTIRYQHVVLPLADIVDDNGVLTLFIMSDGAHHFWEHRPRFSLNTLGNVSSFTASLYKRILKKTPTDDYSLIAAQFKVS